MPKNFELFLPSNAPVASTAGTMSDAICLNAPEK